MAPLPFDQEAEIRSSPDGTLLWQAGCRIWPADGASAAESGERYDATGEFEPESADYLVRQGNRQVICEGVTYKVVSAVEHEFLPHVSVTLMELRPGG